MSKKIRTLIIGVCFLLLLIGALIALKVIKPENKEGSSSNVTSNSYTDLIKEDSNNLESVVIKNKSDEYTIQNVGEKKWKIKELGDIEQSEEMIKDTILSVSTVFASRIVKESLDNLKDFGLEPPVATIEATFKGGKKYKILVGNVSPDSSVLYAVKEGDNKIYGLMTSALENALTTRYDYLDKTMIEGFDAQDSTKIPELMLYQVERYDLKKPIILQENLSRNEENSYEPVLEMVSPVNAMIRENIINDNIYTLFGLKAQEIVDINATKEKLAEYGFDKPTSVLTLKYNKTSSVKITTGKAILCTHAEGEKIDEGHTHTPVAYYAMVEGNPKVFVISAEAADWISISPDMFLSPIAVLPSITDVKSVTVTGDKNYNIILNHINIEKNELAVTVNGKDVNTDYLRKFFQLLLITNIQGLNETTPTQKPSLTIQYDYSSGKTEKIEFYVMEDRSVIISRNGDFAFKGRPGYVDKVLNEAAKLAENKAVDTDW